MVFSAHRHYHWLLPILVVGSLSGCLDLGGCSHETLADVPSPDGKYRAVVFQRNCGATMGFSTELSLVQGREVLGDSGGNVFVADTDHGQAPPGPGGGPGVLAAWRGPDTLVVRHHPRARVFRSDSLHAGVTIRYVRDLLP